MTDSQTFPGPHDIVRRELANGIVVLVRENPHAASVILTGSVNAGSLFEPSEVNGLASFTASLLLRGTQTRDFAAIHELLESNGASLSISGGRHTAGFTGKALAEDLPLLVELLADGLRRPTFPPDYIERLRGQLITGLKVQEQYTMYRAGRAFRRLVFPHPHPYFYPNTGEIDTVSALTREQIVAFHKQHYGPAGMFIVIVGAVDADAAIALIEQQLSDWEQPQQPALPDLPDLPDLDVVQTHSDVMPGKSQSDLVLGVVGPSRFAEDWHTAHLANSILGVFGMYGRIGQVVREQQGMAYYSYSRLDGGMGPGSWRVIAGVNPANVEAAVSAIQAEIRRVTTELVSEDELADSKANFTGRLPRQLESNEGVAGVIVTMERYNLGLEYLLRYEDTITVITREAVLAAAQRYLNPDAYALAVAGPASNGM